MAAVTFDVANSTKHGSKTFNITVGNNPLRLAVVFVSFAYSSDPAPTVTIGGQSMTYVDKSYAINGADNFYVRLYIYKNPPTGSQAVVHNYSAAPDGYCHGCKIFYNVNQGATYDTPVIRRNDNLVNNISMLVASRVGDMVVDGVCSGTEPSAGAGQTRRWWEVTTGHGNRDFAASTEPGVAGDVTMSWTDALSEWPQIAINVRQSAGGNQGQLVASMRRFMDELKRGLLPQEELMRRYREVYA